MALKGSMPNTTKAAVAAMIKYAKHHDLSEMPETRQGVTLCRDRTLVDTPFGPLLQTARLKCKLPTADRDMVATHPLAYLWAACQQGGGFWDLMRAKHALSPSSPSKPWRLVLCADGVVPGNNLAIVNARQIWAGYLI